MESVCYLFVAQGDSVAWSVCVAVMFSSFELCTKYIESNLRHIFFANVCAHYLGSN